MPATVVRGSWGVLSTGQHALILNGASFNATNDPATPSKDSATWGWAFSLNSREELESGALPALERLVAAAALGAAAGCDAPHFILAAVSEHKAHTTSYRLCLPALIVDATGAEAAGGVGAPARDAAGARLIGCAETLDGPSGWAAAAAGPSIVVADGLGARARAPPAPCGWPLRTELARAAAAAAAAPASEGPAVVAVTLVRRGSVVHAAVSVDFPRAAALALRAEDAPWRAVLARAAEAGLCDDGGGGADTPPARSLLPRGLSALPLGKIHHGASHGADESDAAALSRSALRLHLELMRWCGSGSRHGRGGENED